MRNWKALHLCVNTNVAALANCHVYARTLRLLLEEFLQKNMQQKTRQTSANQMNFGLAELTQTSGSDLCVLIGSTSNVICMNYVIKLDYTLNLLWTP